MPAATCWDNLQLQSEGWKEVRELALGNGLRPGQGTYKGSEFILSPFPAEILMVKNLWRIVLGSPIVSKLASLLL